MVRSIYHSVADWLKTVLPAIVLSLLAWFAIGQLTALAATGQAILQGTADDDDLVGVVNFEETESGLLIQSNLTKAPNGTHGFHIHEFGSCADVGNAAGGHYNPDGVKHGLLSRDGFTNAHAGDLGNIEVSQGKASYQATLPGLSLSGGQYPVAGRAVIVHEKPDDFGQPTGNAGGRIGCGTVTLTNPA